MKALPVALAAAGVVGVLGATPRVDAVPSVPPSPAGLPMTVTAAAAPSSLTTFPVYDAAGTLVRHATFRVTGAGGNCCEKYVATTPGGRLLELGGSYPYVSADGGVTWQSAAPPVPLVNGEGAISVTPNGDVYGAAWDAFSGDRLVAYRYTAADGTWTYHENPLHAPVFDRPWLTVVKGPFETPDGATVPYVSVLRGGTGLDRDLELVSYDGLVYAELAPTSPVAAVLPEVAGPLPVVADPDTDVLQPHAQSRVSPLPGGGAIRRQESGLVCSSWVQVLRPDRTWACLDLGAVALRGDVRADSLGRLHEMAYGTDSVTYRVSTDGGATWRATTHRLPGAITRTRVDWKVDSARSLTYVALRVAGTAGQQDTVLRFDTTGGTPSLLEVFHVGRGDLVAGANLGDSGPRMDFASIALLPDGRFAVAYDDTTTRVAGQISPWLAILQ